MRIGFMILLITMMYKLFHIMYHLIIFAMKLFISILIVFSLSACSRQEHSSIFSDFTRTVELEVTDSLDLEKAGILNPAYIQYKDSFLILCNMKGKKEMFFWNLRSDRVTVRSVIGQGADEMPQYSIVKTANPTSFRFANYRQGRIYEIDLGKLQNDSATTHSLVYELPVEEGGYPLRFLETEDHIFGIGLLKEGRIYSFVKKTNKAKTYMDYPLNEDIEGLDYIHKGALFTGTTMAGNKKTLVLGCFGLIDFYEILPDGKLALKREHHYSFPKFKTMETGTIITFDRDDIYGISGIDADEHYVYILYSGKNVKEKMDDAFNCPHLLVYDWDGNPVVHCLLPKSLSDFSIEGNTLYGLSRESIPVVYVYSLDNIANKKNI